MSEKKKDLLKVLLEVGTEKPKKDFYMSRFEADFKLQAISYKELQRVRERATYPTGKNSDPVLNSEEFGLLIVEAGCVEPRFDSPEIFAKFGTSVEAIKELLLPGEISKISDAIMDLSGFGEDQSIEEVKN